MYSYLMGFVAVAALYGAVNVSAIPLDPPELAVSASPGVFTKCTKDKTVALAFVDGPSHYTKKLVDLLDRNDAKGTWFVNGDNYGCIYDRDSYKSLQYVFKKGHQVASHSWDHDDLTTLSGSDVKDELVKIKTAIKKITGADPAFILPPDGKYNKQVQKIAASLGQKIVVWDFDPHDSAGADEAIKAYKKLIAKHPNNVLALNHETYATTVDKVIPYAIQQFKAKGYKLVTVAECLGQSPYISVGKPAPHDSTWEC